MSKIDEAVKQAIEIIKSAGVTAVIAFLPEDEKTWTVTGNFPSDDCDQAKALLNEASNAICQASKRDPEQD